MFATISVKDYVVGLYLCCLLYILCLIVMFACVYWCPTLCRIICFYVLASVLWYPSRSEHKTIFGSFFVGGLTSYVCYLCLFVSSDIQHILTMSYMAGVLSIKDRSCLLFASTCMVHPRLLWSVLLIIFLLVFVMFVFVLWLVCSKMPVFLYCPFLISPSIFFNVDYIRCERLRSW